MEKNGRRKVRWIAVKVDIMGDIAKMSQNILRGYGRKKAISEKSAFQDALDFLARIPEAIPRQLIFSDTFTHTDKMIAKDILSLIEQGSDLTKFLSRGIADPKKKNRYDYYANNLNVTHLHLVPQGTSELLFVCFLDEKAYIVKLGDHSDLGKLDIMKIIDRNWPFVLPYENIQVEGEVLTDEQFAALSGKNINVFIKLSSGRAVLCGGSMSNGISMGAMCRSIGVQRLVRKIEGFLLQMEPIMQELTQCERDWKLAHFEPFLVFFMQEINTGLIYKFEFNVDSLNMNPPRRYTKEEYLNYIKA